MVKCKKKKRPPLFLACGACVLDLLGVLRALLLLCLFAEVALVTRTRVSGRDLVITGGRPCPAHAMKQLRRL